MLSRSIKNQKSISAKHHNYRKLLLGSSLLVIAIGLCAGAARLDHRWPFKTTDSATDIDATRNVTQNPSPKNSNTPTKQSSSASTLNDKTSTQVPVNTDLVPTITQLVETGGQVLFTATVANTTTAGTCVVTFTNPNDRPVTKQVESTNKDSTSLCGPLIISAYEFSYLGTWQVEFHYYSDSQQATTNSSVVIQ